MGSIKKFSSLTLCLMFAATVALWPAFYNGQPFFFPDTTAYVRGADAGIGKLTGRSTAWSEAAKDDGAAATGAAGPTAAAPGSQSVNSVKDKTVLAGRSIYYGAMLYLGDRAGGFWLTVFLQGAVLVIALQLALDALGVAGWGRTSILVATVVFLTPAALFVSFLMPDIYAGLTILSCAVLLTCDLGGRRYQILFWTALLSLSLTFHTTHVLIALAMLVVGGIAYLRRRALFEGRGLLLIGAALGVAYLAGALFSLGVTRLVGAPPMSPPFLMARIIDDGPGYRYLRETCPQNGFVVCRFLDRMPLSSDDFLWRHDPAHGVFAATDPETRRALAKEQYRFALAALEDHPGPQILASTSNALEQLSDLGVSEFEYSDDSKTTFENKVPESYLANMRRSAAFLHTMPIGLIHFLTYASSALGLAFIIYLFAAPRTRSDQNLARPLAFCALTVFGVLANAAFCGVFSGPHDRYEARVIWLIPAVAVIAYFCLRAPAAPHRDPQ